MIWHLSILDDGILAVLVVSVITGFCRGLVRELFSIALWGIALWTAAHYSGLAANYLKPWIMQEQLRTMIAFVAVTAVLIILGGLVISAVSFLIRKTGLSATDRLLGMVFGIFRAIFVVALVVVALNFSGISTQEYEAQSKLYPQFKPAVTWIQTLIPNWMHQMQRFDHSSHELVMANEVKKNIALNDFSHLN